jgi:hypothetical protein
MRAHSADMLPSDRRGDGIPDFDARPYLLRYRRLLQCLARGRSLHTSLKPNAAAKSDEKMTTRRSSGAEVIPPQEELKGKILSQAT